MSENNYKIDEYDKKILRELTKNARITNLQLAQLVNLSPTPCAKRWKRLEDLGFINEYRAKLNQVKLERSLVVFIAVTMDKHTPERFKHFEKEVKKFPEVIRMSMVTGRAEDYLLQVAVRDIPEYERFLLGCLNKIDGVLNVHSSFEMRSVIDREINP